MANTPDKPVVGPWTQRFAANAKEGLQDIKNIVGKDVTLKQRGVGFARVGGIGVGAYMAGDALFRGKTAEGEERSALARVGQFVLGAGVAAGSLVVGKGR